MKRLNYLLICFLVILALPFFQSSFEFVKLRPLDGSFAFASDSSFSWESWFSGNYQKNKEVYLNESFGFRNFFVRLNNQIAFSLFEKAKANSIIIGDDNCLHSDGYIYSYFGKDHIGKDSTLRRMQKLKFISDTLKKLNKNLILVFAANKASFFKEYIPKKFVSVKYENNYESHLKYANDFNIDFIDFEKYFLDNKAKSKYPLFPMYGIHWSIYGASLVSDSLIRYIEAKRKIDMPNIYWDEIEMDHDRFSDKDIADGMNLLFDLNDEVLAYPKIKFESDAGKVKPSILVVADSYYKVMYHLGIPNVFSKHKFWFYNKDSYTIDPEPAQNVDAFNLKAEIDKNDVIVLLATGSTIKGLGWGFIEEAYDLFKGKYKKRNSKAFNDRIDQIKSSILADKNWMENIARKAAENHLSVDSLLLLDAIWVWEHN